MNKEEIEIRDKIDVLKKELTKTKLKEIIVDEKNLNGILTILSSLLVFFIADNYINFNLDNFLIVIGFVTFIFGIGFFIAMIIKCFLIIENGDDKE